MNWILIAALAGTPIFTADFKTEEACRAAIGQIEQAHLPPDYKGQLSLPFLTREFKTAGWAICVKK